MDSVIGARNERNPTKRYLSTPERHMPTRSPNTKEIPRMREFFTGMAFTAGVLGAYLGAVGILVKTFSWLADYPIW